MKISICAETVFTDRQLSGRVEAIAKHGIADFELWTLDHDRDALQRIVDSGENQLMLFCGNRDHATINPPHRHGFLKEFSDSLEEAKKLKCPFIALLSDVVDSRGIPIPPNPPISEVTRLTSYYECISRALEMAEKAGITILLEPLNTLVDHPGYYLAFSQQGFDIIRALNHPRLKLMFDIYHLQVMEGNIIQTIESNLDHIGHIHVADVPGRHEPGTGELNFHNIARMLKANNYDGHVGLECFPTGDSDDAIRKFADIFGS
jgi:hydroxypyruvate isomerase